MGRAIEFLEAHQSPTPSRWREDAQWRRDNEYWLKYARYITLQVLRAMDDQSITQVELAKLEHVRNYLLDNGVYDLDGFNDYINNEQGN